MKKIFDIASKKGLTEFEVYSKDITKNDVIFENGNLKSINSSQNSGHGIRGIKDDKMGVCSFTHDIDSDKAIDRLIESSNFSDAKLFEFAKKSEYKLPKTYSSSISEVSTDKLIQDGQKIIEKIRNYDKEILTHVSFSSVVGNTKISTSLGASGEYRKSLFTAYVAGQIIEGTNFIEADCYKYGIESEYDIDKLVNTFIERMKYARKVSTFESGKTKILFTPKAFMEILETVAEGVNGNTVEKGISPLCNRMNETIFDERFTVIDDGTLDNCSGSRPFDDEGVPTKKNYIFKNGVLKSYIHTLKTAAKTKDTPTGNASRGSYDGLPMPDFNNIIIESGKQSFEEMMDVMQNGIIIDEIMGLSMNNLLNGDFGGNIQMGFKVANGKIEGRIKDAVFNSNIYKILKNDLIGLSNLDYNHPIVDSTFTAIKQPCALFKDINITIK